jgi:hypothetical protein
MIGSSYDDREILVTHIGGWAITEETITVSEPQPFGGWVEYDPEQPGTLGGREVDPNAGWFGGRELEQHGR